MKFIYGIILLVVTGQSGLALQRQQKPSIPVGRPASSPLEIEEVSPMKTVLPPPKRLAGEPGYMEPVQAAALANKMWLGEARTRDLLTQVAPDRWTVSQGVRAGYAMTSVELSMRLDEFGRARQQFGLEPNSAYKAFALYAALARLLPPLNRTAQAVTDLQDRSLGKEFQQAWNDLLTLQEALEPYLKFLLRHHDEIVEEYENDVAGCQARLTAAMSGREQPVTNRRSIAPHFKGRVRRKATRPAKPAPKDMKEAKRPGRDKT